jgi:hypothetical protein
MVGLLVRDAALGDEVEDVVGPVLDGDVLDLRALEGDEFDHGAVQRGGGELRRGAAFHVGDLGAFVGDDEGALELAEVFRVDAEVGLERLGDLHALGDVDEGAAGEHGAVERGELVVAGRDDLAEELAEDLGMLAERLGGVGEDDALLGDDLLDVGVGGFGIELGLDAGEELALLLGNAETLEGPLDVVGHLFPRALGLLALREVVADLVEIDVLEILGGPVRGHGHVERRSSGRLEAEFEDPRRLLLDRADVADGVLGSGRCRRRIRSPRCR